MSTAALSFLPWVRQGAAAAIREVDSLGPAQRALAELGITLSVNNAALPPMTLRLRGPADVLGFDAAQIVRLDPRPGSSDFEPNYFPCIEFDRPDFPWLFTPLRADVSARLRPWLCLVVVRRQEGVALRTGIDTSLPVLEIAAPARPAAELPDLADSWAWAHAQVAAERSAGPIGQALAGSPALSLSRLLCPRLLAPDTDYLAAVVPSFDLGRRAALGETITDAELVGALALAPAWALAPKPPAVVRLPVFYHWEFRSGAGGDFESLVRRLRPQSPPAGFGQQVIQVGQPGFKLPAGFPSPAPLGLQGALLPLEAPDAPPPWPKGAQQPFEKALAAIVNTPGRQQVTEPKADPLLAPPLYGQWHAARATVEPKAQAWLDVLNLDPRHRSVAALGTQVVQEQQEALMASAWEQAGELQQANQRARQLQLGLVASASLHARHFAPLEPDAVLRLSAPALGRVRIAGAAGRTTAAARIDASALPIRAAGTAMRRIGRERGPVTRRVARQGSARAGEASWVSRLNFAVSANFVQTSIDLATVSALRQLVAGLDTPGFDAITEQTVGNMFGRSGFQVVAAGTPVPVQRVRAAPQTADTPTAREFRNAAREHLARVNPARPIIIFAQAVLNMRQLGEAVLEELKPSRSFVALARVAIATGSNAVAPVDTPAAAPVGIDTVMAAPRFRQPMYEALRDLAPGLLLPGLGEVPDDCVLGLRTNRRFVEAYMIGLNVEMARELLWRGYPTDQRGTCFAQFWDVRAAPEPRPDIEPLHQWNERQLGDAAGAPAREQFVMLMRSALLRRYPNAAIFAVRAVRDAAGSRSPSRAAADEVQPSFSGSMPTDVSFFGFDLTTDAATGADGSDGWYLVIQEHPTEPRFGLDEGSVVPSGSHVSALGAAPSGLPVGAGTWGRNSAHTAGLLRQLPVCIAIHASQLLAKKKA